MNTDLVTMMQRRALIALIYGIASGHCLAASLTGVLLSDHEGQGTHASGMVSLLVGDQARVFYYGEPLPRHFRSPVCSQIGAVWEVVTRVDQDATDILRVICRGQVDENVHGPWVVVGDYLESVKSSPGSTIPLLSARLRASPEYRDYLKALEGMDNSLGTASGRGVMCIDVESVGRGTARLRADGDCGLEAAGKSVDMVFRLIRDERSRRWVIDEISFE
jgi:hypothetical protein